MDRSVTDPISFLPLTQPVFHILLALSSHERHGYAIIQEVMARSEGKVRLGSGTLYAAIRRLLDNGLIEESDSRPAPESDDERRRYYRITELGLQVAAAEATRMAELVGLAVEKDLLPAVLAAGQSRGD